MELNEVIKEVLEALSKAEGDVSVPVTFKNTNSLAALQKSMVNAIVEARNQLRTKPDKGTVEQNKLIQQSNEARKEEVSTTKDASKSAQELSQSFKTSSESAQDFADKLKQAGEDQKASAQQLKRIASAVWGSVKSVYREMKSETQKRMGWMKELEESGVRLSKGFDDSFTELANSAKLSHDQFAKFLTSNASSLSRISGTINDSEQKIASAMGNLTGKYGLSANAIQSGMAGFIENVLKYNTQNLTQEQINTQAERYIKNLKELSLATGKTVEQLEKEQKIKENSLWAEQTKRDARLQPIYSTLSGMGLSDSEIRGMMTGRPNEDTSKLAIDPQMRGLMDLVYRNTRDIRAGKNVNFLENLGSYISRNKAAVNNRYLNEINYETAASIQGSVIDSTATKSLGFFNSNFNYDKVKQVSGNKDEGILNKFFKATGIKNVWDNKLNEAKSLSMDNAATLSSFYTGFLEFANEFRLYKLWMVGTLGAYLLKSGFLGGTLKNLFGSGSKGISGTIAKNITGQLGRYWGKTGLSKIFSGISWVGNKTGINTGISKVSNWLMSKILPNFLSKVFMTLGGLVGGYAGSKLFGLLENPLQNMFNKMFGGDWFKKGTLSGNILQLVLKTLGGALGGFIFGGPVGAVVGGAFGLLQGITGWQSSEKPDSSRLLAQNQGINGLTQDTLDVVSGQAVANRMIFTQNEAGFSMMNRMADACERTAAYTESLPKQYSFNRDQALIQSTYN